MKIENELPTLEEDEIKTFLKNISKIIRKNKMNVLAVEAYYLACTSFLQGYIEKHPEMLDYSNGFFPDPPPDP